MSGPAELFLLEEHTRAGASMGIGQGGQVPRHYGDPEEEYRRALDQCGVADTSMTMALRVTGRSPGAMLNGILTNRLPAPATRGEPGVEEGIGLYSALLTPKGRMISDLWIFPDGSDTDEAYLLQVPAAGAAGVQAEFKRVLPPRLARAAPLEDTGTLTLLGPGAPDWMAREVFGLRADAEVLATLPEGGFLRLGQGSDAVLVVRTAEHAALSWTVTTNRSTLKALWRRAVDGGIHPVGQAVLDTLRVEAGRPAYGVDMDDTTIPTEAGVGVRAVDHGKGCYTGQEVIVRIRDRGHVNRHLRGLVFPEGPTPAAGTPLFAVEGEREVGRVTSAVASPRAGGPIGLGWVRREVAPGGRVRVGDGGPEAGVVALEDRPTGDAGVSSGSWAF